MLNLQSKFSNNVFQGVTVDIAPQEKVGIVGRTGAGVIVCVDFSCVCMCL